MGDFVTLAFYKGKSRVVDRVIQTVTRAPYSHVEMTLRSDPEEPAGVVRRGFSSSALDGGVRAKLINFGSGRWDFWTASIADHARLAMERKMQDLKGQPYGYTDLLAFVIPFWGNNRKQWFCSEVVSRVLALGFYGLPKAPVSPGALARWCDDRSSWRKDE